MSALTVQALNLRLRTALMSDGTMREITNQFDCDGDDSADRPAETLCCVVKNHESSWFSIDCRDYDPAILQ